MTRVTCEDVVIALKLHRLSITAKGIAEQMGTDSRTVATALRKATADGRVTYNYKRGIAWYRFKRMTAV